MNKEIIKQIILEGQSDIENVELYDRPFRFEENGRYVFVGIRQAGKSYMLYKRAKQYIKSGHSIKEIVYVNFDDERLLGMTSSDFDLILQAYKSMFDYTPILLFDEIQNIDGWEHFARRLANQKYQVFITGSNAKMLSKDIATILGARFFDEKIFPYTFSEFLGARGVTLDKNWKYSNQKEEVQREFSTYFNWGGFPELLMYSNKRHWLNGLYEKIILGDVISRNKIKNEQALRLAVKKLAENVKQPTSYNRLSNLIKSTGVSTNTASIIEYVTYLKESCLIFSIDNYASKFVERECVKKHYFIDNGLLNIFLTDSNTSLLENICAVNLYEKYHNDDEPRLYFYSKNVEVDFFIPEDDMAIQVSYSLNDYDTRSREINSLIALNKIHPLKTAQIITYDEEESINDGELNIQVIPVWKWLLSFVS